LRTTRDVIQHRGRQPTLAALAPAAVRLERQPRARVHPLGGADARAVARRLAALSGRSFVEPRGP
jgi:hypothetical protein